MTALCLLAVQGLAVISLLATVCHALAVGGTSDPGFVRVSLGGAVIGIILRILRQFQLQLAFLHLILLFYDSREGQPSVLAVFEHWWALGCVLGWAIL